MNMLLTSSSFIFPLITIPYASRILSTEGMGAVSFAQSVASYFALAAVLGIQYYGVRVCAEVRDNSYELSKIVKELLVILLCTTSCVTVIYLICIWCVPQMAVQRTLFLEFTVFIWLTAFGAEWFYQALEQYGYITLRNVIFKCVALAVMFLSVKTSDDYILYGGTVILAGGASNIINLLRLRYLVDFSQHQKLEIKRHFKPMKWFTIAAISSGMYTQIDLVLLGFLGTTSMVGLYQLVSKIKTVLVGCVNAIGGVLLPRLSYYHNSSQIDRANNLLAKTINGIVVLGLGIIGALLVAASQIVLVMGGESFAQSAVPLMYIGPAVLCSAINILLGNYIISEHMEKTWAIINAVGLVIAVALNSILIPLMGIVGSAISISLTEASVLTMRCFACRELLHSIRGKLDIHRTLIAAVSAFVLLRLIRPWLDNGSLLGTCFSLIVFGVLYLVALLLFRESFIMSFVKTIKRKVCRT